MPLLWSTNYKFSCSTVAPSFVTKKLILFNYRRLRITFSTALAVRYGQNSTDSFFLQAFDWYMGGRSRTTASHSKLCSNVDLPEKYMQPCCHAYMLHSQYLLCFWKYSRQHTFALFVTWLGVRKRFQCLWRGIARPKQTIQLWACPRQWEWQLLP